jgi:hypothetical protein
MKTAFESDDPAFIRECADKVEKDGYKSAANEMRQHAKRVEQLKKPKAKHYGA